MRFEDATVNGRTAQIAAIPGRRGEWVKSTLYRRSRNAASDPLNTGPHAPAVPGAVSLVSRRRRFCGSYSTLPSTEKSIGLMPLNVHVSDLPASDAQLPVVNT